MSSEARHSTEFPGETSGFCRADGPDLVRKALDFLRGGAPADGSPYAAAPVARQKSQLCQWAQSLGLLLDPESIIPRLIREGQEHDIFALFDVIPCHPSGGFFKFIEETLAADHTLRAERNVSIKPRTEP